MGVERQGALQPGRCAGGPREVQACAQRLPQGAAQGAELRGCELDAEPTKPQHSVDGGSEEGAISVLRVVATLCRSVARESPRGNGDVGAILLVMCRLTPGGGSVCAPAMLCFPAAIQMKEKREHAQQLVW